MNTTILWHDRNTLGAERCILSSLEGGFRLAGTALCPTDGVPLQVAYTVDVDADWRRKAEARGSDAGVAALAALPSTTDAPHGTGQREYGRCASLICAQSACVTSDQQVTAARLLCLIVLGAGI